MDAELWDVTDAAGTPTGRTHRRGDPDFPASLFHIVSSVCAVRPDGSVLMTRRAAVKDWGLFWELPAGSALAGETSAEAAVRELGEETGVHVRVDDLTLVGRVAEETALFDVYVAHLTADPVLALDPSEVCESEWASWDEVLRRCEAGTMAGPWVARLGEIGARLAELVGP